MTTTENTTIKQAFLGDRNKSDPTVAPLYPPLHYSKRLVVVFCFLPHSVSGVVVDVVALLALRVKKKRCRNNAKTHVLAGYRKALLAVLLLFGSV